MMMPFRGDMDNISQYWSKLSTHIIGPHNTSSSTCFTKTCPHVCRGMASNGHCNIVYKRKALDIPNAHEHANKQGCSCAAKCFLCLKDVRYICSDMGEPPKDTIHVKKSCRTTRVSDV